VSLPSIFDGLRLPVLAAPMFLVSGKELVVASCQSGIAGSFPALNQRSTEAFDEWLTEIEQSLSSFRSENSDKPCGPYGVNLIVHRSNPRMQADLEVCAKHRVPLIITSLGAVKEVVDAVHAYGGVVFHDVTNLKHAKKAAEAGVDGLILVCGGAGGHAGTLNPFALINEIRPHFSGSLILAGAISTGREVAAARVLGADLAYMGTRFIATEESSAQAEYKQMLCQARPGDIVHTPAVSGVPANFMRQSLEQNGYDMQKLMDPAHVDFGQKLTVDDEAKAWKTVWSAGHGVAAIDDIPSVADLVDRLQREYEIAAKQLLT
jgi:nitronate monooxygenase